MLFGGRLRRDKRAASTLIAGVFIVLIILSGFSFYMLATRETENYRRSAESVDQLLWERSREEVVIGEVSITDGGNLNVTAENQGSILTHLVWLGVFDQTSSPPSQRYYSLDEYLNPAETSTNIGSSVAITQDVRYIIQLVTGRGNTIDCRFYPASEVKCHLTLLAVPANVSVGEKITVLLIVRHNATEPDSIESIVANLTADPSSLVTLLEEPDSLEVEGLHRGDTAFFKWVFNATSTGVVNFNASYQNAPAGTYTFASVKIQDPSSLTPGLGSITITGDDVIPWNTQRTYNITVASATGELGPFFIVLYCDGSNVQPGSLGNPGGKYTDVNGEYSLTLRSSVQGGETFHLHVTCGSLAEVKTIVQSPRP